MSKKKIEDIEIEKKIVEILDKSDFSISIREITKKLEELYKIRISPQITKRYLLKLKKEDKIIEK